MKDITRIAATLANQRTYYYTADRSVDIRLGLLKRLKQVIRELSEEIERALWEDLHKSAYETHLMETSIVLSEIDLYLKKLKRWSKPLKVPSPMFLFPSKSYVMSEPYGLALIISPWNYPFQLLMAPLVAAVAAGNVVAVKPSEDAPATAEVVEKIIRKVFDEKYVSVFRGEVEVAQALLCQRFDYIFFTGSPRVGKIVMQAAAEHLTPVTLELGGKSPCIVDTSADIKIAARRLIWGKLVNCGQTCVAPDYLLVQASVKEALIKEMIKQIKAFYGENPAQSDDYPRMVNKRSVERIKSLIAGEKVLYGGQVDVQDKYVEPTLLDCKSFDSPVMQEEIFGPLLPIIEIASITEAISLVNSHEKPLALYYFGDKEIAWSVIRNTSSGGVCINDTILHLANPNLPFGGVGESGIGSYHGKAGFDTFTHKRSILASKTGIDFKLKYPPYKGLEMMKRFLF